MLLIHKIKGSTAPLLDKFKGQWQRLRHIGRQRETRAADLQPLMRRIGITPIQEDYYIEALRHRSRSLETNEGVRVNNERLEFLGDAILDAVCCSHLFRTYPGWDEGNMSKCKSSMVSRPVNNEVGRRLQLEHYLIAVPGALHHSPDIYGNTVEALIGAIYMDQGFAVTERFILKHVIPTFYEMEDQTIESIQNYKSELIEWTQKHHLQSEFVLDYCNSSSPKGTFTYTVWINGKPVGSGTGSSKKRAQQQAAHVTLDKLRHAYGELYS